MFMTDAEAGDEARGRIRIPVAAGIALAVAVVFTIGVGVLPDQVVDWADDAKPVVLADNG